MKVEFFILSIIICFIYACGSKQSNTDLTGSWKNIYVESSDSSGFTIDPPLSATGESDLEVYFLNARMNLESNHVFILNSKMFPEIKGKWSVVNDSIRFILGGHEQILGKIESITDTSIIFLTDRQFKVGFIKIKE